MRLRLRFPIVLAVAALALGSACTGDDGDTAEPRSVLDIVRERGTLVCGVHDSLPGFGVQAEDGSFAGFDIEYCRVIAAAVLGNADAAELRPVAVGQRFTALQGGAIDVLARNTTWTASRDGGEGAAFVTTTFYDGQGMMVRAESGYRGIDDMGGASVCVLSGTTTELNLSSRFVAAGLALDPITFDDTETLQDSFLRGQCDGWTSDKSQLAAFKANFPEAQGGPDALVVFEETFSKEPLGPVVRDGDSRWFDAVNWAVIATIQAEEWGITAANVDQHLTSENPEILRFLGRPVPPDGAVFDPELDLDVDFAVNVIRQVGNYGEIYERNVGPGTPLGLERGHNDLWTREGLLYAPPYR